MKRSSLARAATIAICAAGLMIVAGRADMRGEPNHLPGVGGIHWARDAQPAARPAKNPNLIYHGGTVMHGTFVEAIFWGTSWTNSSFAGDKVSGLQSFYAGMGNSNYAATNGEYTDGSGHVSTAIALGATHFDFSAVTAKGSTTGPILAEVCAQISSPASNGYYPVYVDRSRGHAKFCAWHSSGTCNGVQVQFAFFFNLDGDPGCDPEDANGAVDGHSQGLAALANVSGHELSETMTDNHLDAWYDSNGAENSDKCAWTFGTPLLTFNGGSQWKIQGNWSNSAYNTATRGYPNSSGQKGCIDGGNYK
ncbi:MAG TPA: hypothetical protein VKH42_04125 [Vicinamibacterales bacterium]|nr:hypothetical protein [Vicinamibacterales bacterium]